MTLPLLIIEPVVETVVTTPVALVLNRQPDPTFSVPLMFAVEPFAIKIFTVVANVREAPLAIVKFVPVPPSTIVDPALYARVTVPCEIVREL